MKPTLKAGRVGSAALFLLVIAGTSQSAEGSVIFDDGGTHVINSAVSDVEVLGSHVSVVSGGVVTYSVPPNSFDRGAATLEEGQLKVLETGRIDGGDGLGIYALLSDVSLGGDSYVSGAGARGSTAIKMVGAYTHLYLHGNASVNGDIDGATGFELSGNAVVNGRLDTGDYDGVFVNMSGGTIRDEIFFGNYIANDGRITGGTIQGGIISTSAELYLKIKGGEIQGGFENRAGSANLTMTGGSLDGGIKEEGREVVGSNYRILGGRLNADEGGWLIEYGVPGLQPPPTPIIRGGTIDLFGGEIGYEDEGLGIFLDWYSTLNVYGQDLAYLDGRLTGYLSDGHRLDVALTFGENWKGSFNMIRQDASVPTLADLSLVSQLVAGCKSVSGRVTLAAPAPPGGVTVSVSDTLASATPPATVTIAEGATSKSFTIKTAPVAANESGSVTVSLGRASLSEPLTVRPMGLASLKLAPSTVVGGQPSTGTAMLECAAGPGPVTVDLSTSNAAVAHPLAPTVVVPQGLKSQTFTVATDPVFSKSSAMITGEASTTTKSRRLNVVPAAVVSPTRLQFGSQTVGTTSPALSAVLRNDGVVPFAVNSISLTGTYASWFSQSNNCPANLAAGASCTISVTFTPQAAFSKTAKLSIATSATSTPLSVSLSGTGM